MQAGETEQVSLRKRAAKGVLWSVIQRWGREGISFLILLVLTRLLDPTTFGLIALATVFTTFIEIFLDQGLGAAIVQRTEIDKEHLDTAFWAGILTGALVAAASVASAGLVASLFKEPELAPVLRWLSITFIFGALSGTQMSILERRLAFKSLAARSTIAKAIGGVVGISMAFAGFGVWSLVGQKLAAGFAGVIVLWRTSDWRPGFNVSRQHFKDMFTFGVSIIGNRILLYLSRRSNDLLIGYFLGTTMLGYYTIGNRLLLVLIRLVTGIINAVAFPTFSRLQQDPKRMLRAFYRVTQYTSLLALPAFIGLAILSPEIIPTLFGDQWAQSIPVMQVLALYGIIQSMLAFNGSVIRASGKPSWEFGILLFTFICNAIGFLLVYRWGIVAVAAAYVVVGYVLSPISFVALRKLIRVDFRSYARQYVAPLSASLFMVIIVVGLKYLLQPQQLGLYVQLTIYLTAGILSYVLVILLTARALTQQVLQLVSLALPSWRLKRT